MASNSPVATTRLQQICNQACDDALASASHYDHASTVAWNTSIINAILQGLIAETSGASDGATVAAPTYKFAVNSTIIQHLGEPSTGAEESEGHEWANAGRRGMHSASGAYWNNEKDGMWSHKYEGGGSKGMDIVISIVWIAV